MRSLALLVAMLSLGWASAAVAQPKRSFIPLIDERAVSDVVLGGAAEMQSYPQIATNGDLSLIVWTDGRERIGSLDSYAARMDHAGRILDPLGIHLGDETDQSDWVSTIYVSAVVWNGESFVVIQGRNLTFISPDLSVIQHKKVPLSGAYVLAAVNRGPVVRLLFVKYLTSQRSEYAVVDGQGNVIAEKSAPADPSASTGLRPAFYGAGASGFLIARASGRVDHFDLDGNLLSSKDHGLAPLKSSNWRSLEAVGGGNGWLLLEVLPHSEINGYLLDPDGVLQQKIALSAADNSRSEYSYGAELLFTGIRYLVAWQTTADAAEDWIAEIRLDGAIKVQRIAQLPGNRAGIALAASRGTLVMASAFSPQAADSSKGLGSASDLYARSISPTLQPGEPHLVASTGALQMSPAIAAGDNGYALMWTESRHDGTVYFNVRRFSQSGVPQDVAPLTAMTFPGAWTFQRTKIVSTGNTYVVGAQGPSGYVIRRLAAMTGTWLEPEPVLLRDRPTDIASNGTGVIAVWIDACGAGTSSCLVALPIPTSGPVPSQPVESLAASGTLDPVIASNGSDFLVTWTNPLILFYPVAVPSHSLFAARLHSDGTAVDGKPLVLTNRRYPAKQKIACGSSGTCLVVWFGDDDSERYGIYGTRIARDGAVRALDATDGVRLTSNARGPDYAFAELAALDSRFVLILAARGDTHSWDTVWRTATLAGDAKTLSLSGSETSTLTDRIPLPDYYASIAAAVREGGVAVAYTRLVPEAGSVSRVFLRLFAELPPSPHRRAAGR